MEPESEPVEFTMGNRAHPIMDDYTGPPQSLFVVVCYGGMSPCSISILKLEIPGNNHEPAADMTPKHDTMTYRPFFSSFETQLNQKEYVAHFRRPQGPAEISWLFSPLTSYNSTDGLCMVPYWDRDDVILNGYKFNFKTKTCESIKYPKANKSFGHAVNMKGCIYYLAQPYLCIRTPPEPDPSFERYDPVLDKWESLQPFPHDVCSNGSVVATAVWDDTILFNMSGSQIWAYYSPKNRWYRVDVKDNECYGIVGEAVVVENTIYALCHLCFVDVLALSIKRTVTDDFAFECSLRSKIQVRGLNMLSYKDAYRRTGHLVHLGKHNFCLVQSCKVWGWNDLQQPIHVTNIKLKEEESKISMTVVCQRQHLMRIVENYQFHVVYCFSVPEDKTIELKEDKSFIFHLNPFPKDFDPTRKHINYSNDQAISLPSNVASKVSTTLADDVTSGRSVTDEEDIPLPPSFCITLGDCAASGRSNTDEEGIPLPPSFCTTLDDCAPFGRSNTDEEGIPLPPLFCTTLGDCAASERSNADEEGYSVYVTNIPDECTFCQLELELKTFGPIKSDGIEVIINMEEKPYAIVEFKSQKSMLRAIEASPVKINGCRVLIKEKK